MRRLALLFAPLLLLVGLAAPASAAPTINTFTVNGEATDLEVEADSDIDVEWEVTGGSELTVEVTVDGDTIGDTTTGAETVPGPAAGESVTVTLDASDTEGPVSETIVVTAEDDDTEEPGGDAIAEVTGGECRFTVENVAGEPILVVWGDADGDEADDAAEIDTDETRSFRTPRENLLVVALRSSEIEDDNADVEFFDVEVSQTGCDGGSAGGGTPWPVPVNAPAAGAVTTDGSGAGLWSIAGLLALAGLGAAGLHRRRAA